MNYEKLDSKFNIYPFKTCPTCGLTYAIMGEKSSKLKKDKSRPPIIKHDLITEEDDESSRSLLISIDSFNCSTHELIDEANEFLLADILEVVDYEKKWQNEKFEHSLYCARFKAARKKYHPHVITYQERCYIVNKILPMLNINQDITTKELLIQNLYEVLFTESLEMTDFSLSHPKFHEYISLLWNTKWFIDEMEKYLSQKEIAKIKNKYPQNNGIRRGLRWWTTDKHVEDYGEDEEDCFDIFAKQISVFMDNADIEECFK